MEIAVKHMFLRGERFFTNFAHPLIKRSNGKSQLIRVATGLNFNQVESAQKWSDALELFKSDPAWHRIAKYGEARQIHEGAAKAFFSCLSKKIDVARAIDETHVNWPEIVDDGHFKSEVISIDEALRRACEIEGAFLKEQVASAEKDAMIATLQKELGKTLSGKNHALADLVPQYLSWGKTSGKRGRAWSAGHLVKVIEYMTHWTTIFKTLAEITVESVESEQSKMLLTRKRKTVSNYTGALAAFMTYCVVRKYLLRNPLMGTCKLDNSDAQERRALTPDEIRALFEKCSAKRRLVYEVALCSGLRANELASLMVEDLDVERCGFVLHPEWTKNRKPGFQPIVQSLVEKLKVLSVGKASTSLLLTMPSMTNLAQIFKSDCRRAGIDPSDTGDGVLVFHSLRATFLTLVDQSGASAKTTQSLARHSTPDITFARYVKSIPAESVRAADDVGRVVMGSATA